MEKGKIICGFAGVGKSYLAKNKEGFVDLESTPFEKNWDLYTDVAIHMAQNGYTVMLSCHKELRNKLKEKGAEYIVVIPKIEHKENYIKRYQECGNDNAFIQLFKDKWDDFINEIKDEEENVATLEEPHLTLGDLF